MSTLATPSFFRGIASLLYPPSCTICSAPVDVGEYLCQDCEAKVSRIVPPFCAKCSEPFAGAITTTFACANCAHHVLHFEAAVSAYRSRGIVRHVILNFKYGRQIHLRHLVARWLLARSTMNVFANAVLTRSFPSRYIRRNSANADLIKLRCWRNG